MLNFVIKKTAPSNQECTENVNFKNMGEFCDDILYDNKRNEGVIIGLNGPSASGKSTIAQKMCSEFTSKNYHSIVFPLDYFLFNRINRFNLINNPDTKSRIMHYLFDSWDITRFCSYLNEIFQAINGNEEKIIHLNNIYDRKTGLTNAQANLFILPKSIIIVEGTEAINCLTESYYDVKIKISSSTEAIFERLVQREYEKPIENRITQNDIIHRFNNIEKCYIEYIDNLGIKYDYEIEN